MSNAALDEMDRCIAHLREKNCYRFGSQWLDADSTALGSDPIEAVRALRHRAIKRVVEGKRSSGEHFTR